MVVELLERLARLEAALTERDARIEVLTARVAQLEALLRKDSRTSSKPGVGWVGKAQLAALAVQTGLQITVCHFPPGTSKWNKVEHRLFSHITMNWRGRPLSNHEVIVQSIAATTTRTGLRVHAELDTSTYDTGPYQRPADQRGAAATPRLARRLELHAAPQGVRAGRHCPRSIRPAQSRPDLATPPGPDRTTRV